jgi:polyribonucleotide nucleotidyltransferase
MQFPEDSESSESEDEFENEIVTQPISDYKEETEVEETEESVPGQPEEPVKQVSKPVFDEKLAKPNMKQRDVKLKYFSSRTNTGLMTKLSRKTKKVDYRGYKVANMHEFGDATPGEQEIKKATQKLNTPAPKAYLDPKVENLAHQEVKNAIEEVSEESEVDTSKPLDVRQIGWNVNNIGNTHYSDFYSKQ